jgi:uncharacterized membrane protein
MTFSILAHSPGNGVTFGDFHVVILHFPIVLVTLLFVFDVLYSFGKVKTPYIVGHWLTIFAAILIIPTVWTGFVAADVIGDELPQVIIHRNFALATMIYTFFYGVYRAYRLYSEIELPSLHYIGLSLINVVLIAITADLGGIVAFGKGIIFNH